MKIRKELKEEKKQKIVCGDGEKKEEKIVNLNDSVSLDEYDHEDDKDLGDYYDEEVPHK